MHSKESVRSEDPESNGLLEDGEQSRYDWKPSEKSRKSKCWPNIGLLACLIATYVVVFALGFHWPRDLDTLCLNHANIPSPVTNDLGLKYKDIQFESKLFSSSPYRGNASDEVDAAWHDLGMDFKFIIADEDVALEAGVPPDNAKLTPKKGKDRYGAVIGVFHQLHCLNFLRKAAWFNYPYYRAMGKDEFANPAILEDHVGHCIEVLRQQLMCTADVGLVSFVWVKDREVPTLDFTSTHRCRDFDAIHEWAREHQTLDQTPDDFPVRQPGDREIDGY